MQLGPGPPTPHCRGGGRRYTGARVGDMAVLAVPGSSSCELAWSHLGESPAETVVVPDRSELRTDRLCVGCLQRPHRGGDIHKGASLLRL